MSNAAGITVRVPLAIRRRGGRKLVVTPDGAAAPGATPARSRANPALVKALARAYRWKRLLESGRYGSLAELAAAEKIDRSYLAKTLRLTLLAPVIVEAILDGRQPCALVLPALLESVPSLWDEQRASMAETSHCASLTVGVADRPAIDEQVLVPSDHGGPKPAVANRSCVLPVRPA